MDEIKTEGIVLRKIPYGDNDLIATFLTRQGGLLTVFVAKEKGSKKRFGPCIDLFNHLSFSYSHSQKSDMVFLKNCELITGSSSIRNDLVKFASLCFFAEAILVFLRDNQAVAGVFSTLISWMEKIKEGQGVSPSFLLLTQNHFLQLFGFKPHLSSCLDCTSVLADKNLYHFISHVGGILCQSCLKLRGSHEMGAVFNGDFLQKVNRASDLPIEAWQAEIFQQDELILMRQSFNSFIQYQAGKPFKTLPFLSQVL